MDRRVAPEQARRNMLKDVRLALDELENGERRLFSIYPWLMLAMFLMAFLGAQNGAFASPMGPRIAITFGAVILILLIATWLAYNNTLEQGPAALVSILQRAQFQLELDTLGLDKVPEPVKDNLLARAHLALLSFYPQSVSRRDDDFRHPSQRQKQRIVFMELIRQCYGQCAAAGLTPFTAGTMLFDLLVIPLPGVMLLVLLGSALSGRVEGGHGFDPLFAGIWLAVMLLPFVCSSFFGARISCIGRAVLKHYGYDLPPAAS